MASELFVDKIYPGPNSTSVEVNATSSFVVKTNGSTQLTIDSTGTILKPNQPAFSAYSTITQDIGANTWTKMTFDSVRFNIGSDYNVSDSIFTAPYTGRYMIGYTVAFNTASNEYYYSGIKINGTFYHYGEGRRLKNNATYSWDGDNTLGACQLVSLNVNDQVEAWAFSTSANTLAAGESRRSFFGYLLG